MLHIKLSRNPSNKTLIAPSEIQKENIFLRTSRPVLFTSVLV